MLSICDVPGIRVGHQSDPDARTGCSVVLPDAPAVGGVDVRGSAPGTREVELLHPVRLVQRVDAVGLCGGSAFGLDAISGMHRYLAEQNRGFDTGVRRVPIVPGAVLFDLGVGRADAWPDAQMGYNACLNASDHYDHDTAASAGCGATAGKAAGMASASRGGMGTSSVTLPGDIVIGALIAVNPLGEIIHPETGEIVAGIQNETRDAFIPTLSVLKQGLAHPPAGNTTLAVVATNATLNREQAVKVAQMAQDGLARTIRPAHTLWDGDIVFVLSCGTRQADVSVIGAFAAETVAAGILNAVA
ncbi:MAG: P1 family peptidase [candidate division KSB1 bacterium]|nr:P1 family peptidase [candidate division KSB1 bacterium]